MCQMVHRFYALILSLFSIQSNTKCNLNSRVDFGQPLPVILRNGRLLQPSDKFGNIVLDRGEVLTLSCESVGSIRHPNLARNIATVAISCASGDYFQNNEWLSSPGRFSQFRCDEPPKYASVRTNRTCYDGNTVYEVGYSVQNQFYPLYESCFNEGEFRVIYSKYNQKPFNFNFQTKVDRPYFMANDVYGYVPVESLYMAGGLKTAIAQIVGPLINTYFINNQTLSRGHLAAKTDFVFAFGQRATFHYVNCAPQWTGFNGGNWNTLEVDLRHHIHRAGYDTIIYTGTFGVTQLFNQYRRRVDLYLYTDSNNNQVIPVPQYYYKVVYEPQLKKGVAFVGINNPYYTADEVKNLIFCQDICKGSSEFYWLSWNPYNLAEGYTFCCTVSDFMKTVRHLPPLEVNGVLT